MGSSLLIQVWSIMATRKSIILVTVTASALLVGLAVYFSTPTAEQRLTHNTEFQKDADEILSEESVRQRMEKKLAQWNIPGSFDATGKFIATPGPEHKEQVEKAIFMAQMNAMDDCLKEAFQRRGSFSLPMSKLTKPESDALMASLRVHSAYTEQAGSQPFIDNLGDDPIVTFDADSTHTDSIRVAWPNYDVLF
jgi:flagellar biogenesis protein FliO